MKLDKTASKNSIFLNLPHNLRLKYHIFDLILVFIDSTIEVYPILCFSLDLFTTKIWFGLKKDNNSTKYFAASQ
jgi:hypothetical protein